MRSRKARTLSVTWMLATIAMLASLVPASAQQVVISDSTFNNGSWKTSVYATGGATQSATQMTTGGNPGAYRHVTHVLPLGSHIFVDHFFLGPTYDPISQGAVDHIDLSMDCKVIQWPYPGAAVRTSFLIVQDGTKYYAGNGTFANTTWGTRSHSNMKASDFEDSNGTGTHPDFSASGSPMQFGFTRSNTSSGTAKTMVHGIDNWEVRITPIELDLAFRGQPRVAQVVWDAEITKAGVVDLVLMKPTVVEFDVDNRSNAPIPTKDVEISLQLLDSFGRVFLNQVESIDAGILLAGSVHLYFTPHESVPQPPGTAPFGRLLLELNPNKKFQESDWSNNRAHRDITVLKTSPLAVYYVHIPDCSTWYMPPDYSCYGGGPTTWLAEDTAMKQYAHDATLHLWYTYPSATYALDVLGPAPIGHRRHPEDQLKYGNYWKNVAIMKDILEVDRLRRLKNYKRGIGLVPDGPSGYFAYHKGQATTTRGMTFPYLTSAIAVRQSTGTVLHELGHTYNLRIPPEKEEYKCTLGVGPCRELNGGRGHVAQGFWVAAKRPVDTICFMGNATANWPDFSDVWVENECYNKIFDYFLLYAHDPEVLILTAILGEDGTVELGPWNFMTSGSSDPSEPGDYSIRVLDFDGTVLDEVNKAVAFAMAVEPDEGWVPTSYVPFAASIPYSQEAAFVEIALDGHALVTVETTSKLLADAFASVPDSGFVANAGQRRNALQNKVGAMANMLAAGNAHGAYQKLTHDVRPTVMRWLVDGYVTESPLEMEKQEVLDLIDALLIRLENMQH